ncbi:MAG TPA: isoprenylcysteine carboxylmethyltransferase family protein [Terriglobales bacterium]|nr:isoprenylcysteine carboxylmethyltransferase family protein [Terriglobales bacterium]
MLLSIENGGSVFPMHIIRMIAWLISGIYATIPVFWLIIHPFADSWRRRFRAPLKVITPIWILLWITAWMATYSWRYVPLLPYPYAGATGWRFSGLNWISLAAIPFWTLTFFIYSRGIRHLSIGHAIGRTELEPDRQEQRLITTGLHARMRHPLYFGHFCTMLGWLALSQTRAVLALLVWAVLSGAFMIRAEEAELERRFGEAFREYRKRVPALIPRI